MFAAELRQELDKGSFVSVTTDAETPESGAKSRFYRPFVRGQRRRRCLNLFIKVKYNSEI